MSSMSYIAGFLCIIYYALVCYWPHTHELCSTRMLHVHACATFISEILPVQTISRMNDVVHNESDIRSVE